MKEHKNMIGARVRLSRKEQGLTRIQLIIELQRAGIKMSLSALSRLEKQQRRVTDIEFRAIANALNVSMDWLLGREHKAPSPRELAFASDSEAKD